MIDISTLSAEERRLIEARRAYTKAWRTKNPDKVRKHVENFLKKQAEKYISGADTVISVNDETD